MLRLLIKPRKITLIFVLRDKTPKVYTLYPLVRMFPSIVYLFVFNDWSCFLLSTQTPLKYLESILREDIQKVSILSHFLISLLILFMIIFNNDMNSSDLEWNSKT